MSRYQLPNVTSARGAPMGRANLYGTAVSPVKLRMERVYINGGGYDSGGAYWGNGAPLWVAWGHDGREVRLFVRATDRTAAKVAVQRLLPGARFHR